MHVIFKINKAKTEFGQSVHIIGNQKAIGAWKVSHHSIHPIKFKSLRQLSLFLKLLFDVCYCFLIRSDKTNILSLTFYSLKKHLP